MSKSKTKKYDVLCGFNDSKEQRFEIGETVSDSDLSKEDLAELLKVGAIREKE